MNRPAPTSKEAAMSPNRESIMGAAPAPHPQFRFAPAEWTPEAARRLAAEEGLALHEDHWEVLRGLQEFYARHEAAAINLREIKDALEEKFHHKGGLKYLHTLFPRGPVAQGCRLAGLKAPAGAVDLGFGSVA
jgi:tRNA 2-thiouridine synthesizing protein E